MPGYNTTGKKFTPDKNIIQCCVLLSETEEMAESGESLESIVRRTLLSYHQRIKNVTGKSTVELEPYTIEVSKAFSSPAVYRDTIIALCRCDIAIFDMTNYEPAIMFFLGIRSVVRRGITISSAGGDYILGDTMNFPFNIKEVNLVSHSDKQVQQDNPNTDPINLIGQRILGGFSQLAQLPNYLDLPAFDAVRNLPRESINQKSIIYTDRVLILCSFSKEYQENNWKRHLKRKLPVHIKARLSPEEQGVLPDNKPDIFRTLDMKTPRLVSQTLYEAIRLTDRFAVVT